MFCFVSKVKVNAGCGLASSNRTKLVAGYRIVVILSLRNCGNLSIRSESYGF